MAPKIPCVSVARWLLISKTAGRREVEEGRRGSVRGKKTGAAVARSGAIERPARGWGGQKEKGNIDGETGEIAGETSGEERNGEKRRDREGG